MRKRTDLYPQIGSVFRQLRKDAGLGLRQAARIAESRKFSRLNMNTLGFLERGATKNVEPELLQEIAALYKASYADLVGRYLTARFKMEVSARDLPDHDGGVKDVELASPANQKGPPHDPATARALRDVTVAYEAFFRAVQDVSDRLHRLVSDAESAAGSSEADSGTSGRRRRR